MRKANQTFEPTVSGLHGESMLRWTLRGKLFAAATGASQKIASKAGNW